MDVLAGSELRVAHARALIDLGAALRRGAHRREAREPLRDGLDLANRCGSRRRVEMHLTGAYRKLGVSGRGELSAAVA